MARSCFHCRACRNAIVNDDRDLILRARGRSITEIKLASALDLHELALGDCVELRVGSSRCRDHLFVSHSDGLAAIHNGPNREFGVHRGTDFAHENEVKRRIQRSGDFRRDLDPATRQRQDNGLVFVAEQRRGELAPGVRAISKEHRFLRVACRQQQAVAGIAQTSPLPAR